MHSSLNDNFGWLHHATTILLIHLDFCQSSAHATFIKSCSLSTSCNASIALNSKPNPAWCSILRQLSPNTISGSDGSFSSFVNLYGSGVSNGTLESLSKRWTSTGSESRWRQPFLSEITNASQGNFTFVIESRSAVVMYNGLIHFRLTSVLIKMSLA